MANFRHITAVKFPIFAHRHINMMPIILGDPTSIPCDLHDYLPMINACDAETGGVAYLTIDERSVESGTHRRAGIHTEGFGNSSWGSWGRIDWGGSWGGQKGGLYMANSIPESCSLYDTAILDTPFGGAVSDEQLMGASKTLMPANNLFWLHDRTPHASLPVKGDRQFFRLVVGKVSVWFSRHSTANPLGIQPKARIVHENKFDRIAQ